MFSNFSILNRAFLIKNIILLGIISICSSYAEAAGSWTKVSDSYPYVNAIFCPKGEANTIFVAADEHPTDFQSEEIEFYHFAGKGCQIIKDGKTISAQALDGYSVYAFCSDPKNPSKYYASVRALSPGKNGIFISEDKGTEWKSDDLKCSRGNSQIVKIIAAPSGDMYASSVKTSDGFIKTNDGFDSYTSNESILIQSRDLTLSKLNPDLLFIAGDGLHASGVFRSYDKGENWLKDDKGINGLRILSVLPSQYSANVVFCAADSVSSDGIVHPKGIYRSLDSGTTWELVKATTSTVYQLVQHPRSAKHIVAACGTDGVMVSGSYGWAWETFNDGLLPDADVRCVGIPDKDLNAGGVEVFAGLYGGAYPDETPEADKSWLFKSAPLITSVDDFNDSYGNDRELTISPNPVRNNFSVSWINPSLQKINISIIDMNGRIVKTLEDKVLEKGNKTISSSLDLTPGAYLFVIKGIDYSLTKNLIIIK